MTRALAIGTALVIGLVTLEGAACGSSKPPDKPPAAAVEHPPLVTAYEALRDRFAHDDLAGAKSAAAALGKLSDGAMQAATTAIGEASDLGAARLRFGDLSKAYLELLAKKPDLANGLYAFRCPMAEGYQKWVQVDSELKNPYQGSKMLECGSKVDLTP